jgi:hypothetical protein
MADQVYMDKADRYRELVERRKACSACEGRLVAAGGVAFKFGPARGLGQGA